MKNLIILLFLFVPAISWGQLAIINDHDGYTNVREGKSIHSKVMARLYEDRPFLYYIEDSTESWVEVFYHVPFKDGSKEFGKKEEANYLTGYIHKSRLLPLDDLKASPKSKKYRKSTNNELTISNKGIKLVVKLDAFKPEKHALKTSGGRYNMVEEIDGKEPWGVDGNMPHTQTSSIKLSVNNLYIKIPKSAYSDIYELNLKSVNIYTSAKGTIYIYSPFNSDGAGSYDIVWIIRKGKYLGRYIDSVC